jgi:GNAT superfamily N-acetyltransferase
MKEDDLGEADRIMRLAFGTFLGLPEPLKFMGDADYVKTRFRADPPAALVAEVEDRMVGSNFALDWGSVGIFGPLTIDPNYWDKGVARSLLENTMKIFDRWGTKHIGLFTFAQSTKHIHLYQKFGFWPRYLTAVMSKQLEAVDIAKGDTDLRLFSGLRHDEKSDTIRDCAGLSNRIFSGLDMRKEIESVDRQKLGDTILLMNSKRGDELVGFAVCHTGPDTEAGSRNCYVKFAGIAPGNGAALDFDRLLAGCEQFALARDSSRLVGGVNTARHNAYVQMIKRGFRTDMQGIAMHNPNEAGYNVPDAYVIDDWR